MSWANPFFLILLILPLALVVFYLWAKQQRQAALEQFALAEIFPKIMQIPQQHLRRSQAILRIIGIICLVLALAGPQWGYQWIEVKNRGLEIIFALDTSKSMLATDVKPSRLERSKLAIKDFLNQLSGDKVGLIAFSGSSFLQCPLTLDYGAFGIALDSLNTESIPRGGTALGEALNTAEKAFKSGSSGSKILVLITDGENHEGNPVETAKKLASQGVHLYTIGIGSSQGEIISIQDAQGNSTYLKDAEGNLVKSVLNEQLLRKIAKTGKGAYLHGTGLSLGLEELYNSYLNKYQKTELKSKLQKRNLNHYQLPLFLTLLLLIVEFLLAKPEKTLWQRIKLLNHKEAAATSK